MTSDPRSDGEAVLDAAARAYRREHDGRREDVAAERAELLRRHRRGIEQRTAWLAAAAVVTLLFGIPTAWALRSALVQGTTPAPRSVVVPAPAPAPVSTPAPERTVTPEPGEPVIEAPASGAPIEPERGHVHRASAPRAAAPTIEPPVDPADRRAYDAAHALHFEARDPAAAIDAWDAYLSAHPRGRFVTEARYNRALALVRLGRRDEAIEALAPFARGEHHGYRAHEATQLLEALGAN